MEDIAKIKKYIAYEFNNKELLKEALTHPSYAQEKQLPYDNQRLEHLGDAIIDVILTEYLFFKYPEASEGLLTIMRAALVKQDSLAMYAKAINLGDFLLMGRGEAELQCNLRPSSLSDLFEAVTGAIYLDGGLSATREFLLPLVTKIFPEPAKLQKALNPKGALQEYTQRKYGAPPNYNIIAVDGPDHNKQYTVSVTVNKKILSTGSAHKIKNAESVAAKEALTILIAQEGS